MSECTEATAPFLAWFNVIWDLCSVRVGGDGKKHVRSRFSDIEGTVVSIDWGRKGGCVARVFGEREPLVEICKDTLDFP